MMKLAIPVYLFIGVVFAILIIRFAKPEDKEELKDMLSDKPQYQQGLGTTLVLLHVIAWPLYILSRLLELFARLILRLAS